LSCRIALSSSKSFYAGNITATTDFSNLHTSLCRMQQKLSES
jgi:hypothetical protein